MKIRKNVLWTVPVYNIAAGFIYFYLMLQFFPLTYLRDSNGEIMRNPDGTPIEYEFLQELFYYIIFIVLTLLAGVLFLRKMTRREIFWSTTIFVGIQLFFAGVELLCDAVHLRPLRATADCTGLLSRWLFPNFRFYCIIFERHHRKGS